jgi:hypothetical protein
LIDSLVARAHLNVHLESELGAIIWRVQTRTYSDPRRPSKSEKKGYCTSMRPCHATALVRSWLRIFLLSHYSYHPMPVKPRAASPRRARRGRPQTAERRCVNVHSLRLPQALNPRSAWREAPRTTVGSHECPCGKAETETTAACRDRASCGADIFVLLRRGDFSSAAGAQRVPANVARRHAWHREETREKDGDVRCR